jgi:hypothetical protein
MTMESVAKLHLLGLTDEPTDAFTDVTIDSVLQELTVWRETKAEHKQPGFPDPLWRRILWLGQQHGETKIRSLLGISSQQYKIKAAQLARQADPGSDKPSDDGGKSSVPFVEMAVPTTEIAATASEQAVTTTQASIYQAADVTIPDAHTVSVVELCRADGMVMKIHTVNNHWRALIEAFWEARSS